MPNHISILYANLFQKALSANQLVEITNLIESIGDKQLAQVVVSSFMNRPDVRIPTNAEMRADVDKFINEPINAFWYGNQPNRREAGSGFHTNQYFRFG